MSSKDQKSSEPHQPVKTKPTSKQPPTPAKIDPNKSAVAKSKPPTLVKSQPENEFDKFLQTLLGKIDLLSHDVSELKNFREQLVGIFEEDEILIVDEEIGEKEQELFQIKHKYEERNKFYKEEIMTIKSKLQQRNQILNSAANILKKNKKLCEFFIQKQQELTDLFNELVRNVE